jgi:CRISPR-associated endonuclease/helicase Cas3
MAQRFGRCNRYGEFNDAKIYWIDIKSSKNNEEYYLPYKKEDLDNARKILNSINSAKITAIEKIALRRKRFLLQFKGKNMVELFDTTPDISGLFVDVSRFSGAKATMNVQVYGEKISTKSRKLRLRL